MRGLILALQLLTRLPVPSLAAMSAEAWAAAQAASTRWYPLVGLLIGGLLVLAAWGGAQVDAWLGALAALTVWVAVTGALHLDGLADLADALGAAHGRQGETRRERLLAVLADPHLGAFGVVALVMQIIAKLILLMLLVRAQAWPALLLIPAWSRWGVLLWLRLPAIKPGLGASHATPSAGGWIALWALLLVAACWLSPILLLAPLVVLAWRAYLMRKLGGMSGDALGAGIEWTESFLLLLVVL